MAYEFHYTPTGTGVISGKEVLEQTEDAINDLGNTAISGVQEAVDKAEQALTNSANAVDDAQTALNTANNAEGVAIQAQNDVSNLSETVTNLGNRVTTDEGNITDIQGRMTTAEGNITNLQGRMTTAEGNIGNLQTAVSTAQATANSAQQTATTARQQSYVFRYSSTTLVASSTNSNSLLDNTDNLKVGDKVIDSSGVIYSVTTIDTANSTFTIGTSLIDLAQDSDVVHKSGDETVAGFKTFSSTLRLTAYPSIRMNISDDEWGVLPQTTRQAEIRFTDKNSVTVSYFVFQHRSDSNEPFRTCWRQHKMDGTTNYHSIDFNNLGDFYPETNNTINFGTSSRRWKSVYATNYYYGSNNVEFSTKFVTTDTAQTVSGSKTFKVSPYIYNSDSTVNAPNIILKNSKYSIGDTTNTGEQRIIFTDKNSTWVSSITSSKNITGSQYLSFTIYTTDTDSISSTINYYIAKNGERAFTPYEDGLINLGIAQKKWKDVNTYLVNGVEPSSLGMPSDRSARVDISSYFTDTSNGAVNRYTVPANGYVYLNVADVVSMHLLSQTSNNLTQYGDTKARGSVGQLNALLPVRKDDVFACQWYTTATNVTLTNAFFIPCQGNV